MDHGHDSMPIELPPEAAIAFVRDMKAFFKAKGQLMQDEIAAKQMWLLKQRLPRGTKLRTTDVKELFDQMRDQGAARIHDAEAAWRQLLAARPRRLSLIS